MPTDGPSAFVLVGPTASGKSAVAHFLAAQMKTAVVSADSMNVYRGMDIGTAKPSPAARAAVPYFGLDLAEPAEAFSVGDWLAAVKPAWGQSSHLNMDVEMRGLTPIAPIVAGGTGLYVKCLLQGLAKLPAADEELRNRAGKMTLTELQDEVRKVAPEAYEALADQQNPRRLIRLLEKAGGKERARFGTWEKNMPCIVGLHVDRDVLRKRIAERVDRMYADGLIEEARGLIGLELSATARHAIGYAEAFAVLRGECTATEAKERTIVRSRQLAKRQMTWFRHQFHVKWIETADFPDVEKLADNVSAAWERVPVSL